MREIKALQSISISEQIKTHLSQSIKSKYPLPTTDKIFEYITTLIFNIHTLFIALPPLSSLRKQLIKQLKPSLPHLFLSFICSVTKTTINKSKHATDITTQQINSFKSTKKIASFKQIDTILNEIAPYQSGRNYRIITTTFKHLF